VRTVAEIEQQTETGEFLLSNLMRAQLSLAIRLGLVIALVLGAMPLLFLGFPGIADTTLLGVRLPWLLLGLLPYPVLFAMGWLYTHHAERNELDFADNVED
jgi:fatty acid desaturase